MISCVQKINYKIQYIRIIHPSFVICHSSFVIFLLLLSLSAYSQIPLPNRLWGSYYGGSENDVVFSMCRDPGGNIIICGSTGSSDNIATSGAFQETLSGEEDVFVAKFTPDGTRLWGTYFGGPLQDIGWSCMTDSSGNIYFSGHTLSASGIASPGAHQTVLRGERDAFLAKFSPEGQRVWATYYGGNIQEAGYGCGVEPDGTVYLTGYTNSPGFIATPGAHQPDQGGDYDGFLVKFSSEGQRIWGTYYGGILNDAGSGCRVDDESNLYLSGSSISTGAIATPGSHQSANGGDFDAFLVKFTANGQRLWGSYYGGIYADQGMAPAIDSLGNIYLSGYTQSPDNIATPGAHQELLGGMTDGFLVKFDPDGDRIWGTYYGGEEMDEIRCCDANAENEVFISGYTVSPAGIATTNSFQPIPGGAQDAFLAKFNPSGQRAWGTYYGASGDDAGYACLSLGQEEIFLAGYSGSIDSIATPGSLQPTYGGGDRDGFLVKFREAPVGIRKEGNQSIVLYPNPTTGLFTIQATLPGKSTCHLTVFNLLGNTLFYDLLPGDNLIRTYNLSLNPGIYLVRISEEDPKKIVHCSLLMVY